LLYSLLKTKGLVITFAVVVLALLTPTPVSNWGLSASYYWQWVEGQAKVLTTFLLLLSFYFGRRGQPYQSGIALAFGFFDPRFGLMALPLFVMYNRKKLKASILSVFASMLVFNAILLYPGLASGFIDMVWASAVTTPLYYYSFIPFLTLCSLIIVNLKEIATAFDYYGILAKYTGASKKRCWRW
jgi:hypothetical protein